MSQPDKAVAAARAALPGDAWRVGALHVITGSLTDGGKAACWIAVTQNGRYAYTTNTGTGTISGFKIAHNGSPTTFR